VKALVGGQEGEGHVNLALGKGGGGSGRQAGSTFKAFMLARVIKDGYSVNSVFPAPPEVELPGGNANGTPWTVTNFEDETVPPEMNLVDATALSVNTVYAQVVDRIGAANLDTMAEALGINPSELAGAYPSQVLGTVDVSPLEMAAAYATFADAGVYHTPVLVSKVTNANGTPLPLPVVPQSRVVLSAAQAAKETYVLQQVVLRGTGVTAGDVGSEVAGKTGTTEHSTDAWFIGYTRNLTTAVWMGYANSARPMNGVQGGSIPAQLWHNFMVAALASEPQYVERFPPVYYLGGTTLTPPAPGSVLFPLGLGTTTTAPPSTTTTSPSPTTTSTTTPTSTSAPTPTTVRTPPPTTAHAHPTTTVPATTTRPGPTTSSTRPATTATAPTHSTGATAGQGG
jgi:penicillin-binding protein 1A